MNNTPRAIHGQIHRRKKFHIRPAAPQVKKEKIVRLGGLNVSLAKQGTQQTRCWHEVCMQVACVGGHNPDQALFQVSLVVTETWLSGLGIVSTRMSVGGKSWQIRALKGGSDRYRTPKVQVVVILARQNLNLKWISYGTAPGGAVQNKDLSYNIQRDLVQIKFAHQIWGSNEALKRLLEHANLPHGASPQTL